MAYSPRSQTNETSLDKKLHGLIDANGNVTELPQYASWQWALLFHQAGVNDVDSYFELISFIGGSAAWNYGGVTQINNNWPATVTEAGAREVSATQAIRHLGLGTVPTDDVLAANLISRGGYIQDYLTLGLDPVAVILPGYITVAEGDTLYTAVVGGIAENHDFTVSVKVGTNVKAGTYPVKRGAFGASAGGFGPCGYNQYVSTINEIWAPGYEEFGVNNVWYLLNLRSLTYIGASSFSSTSWGDYLCGNHGNKLCR